MGGLSSLVWKYILTGFPGYLREGGGKLRHSPLHFPPLSPIIIINIAFTFLLTRSIAIAIVQQHQITHNQRHQAHQYRLYKSSFIFVPELFNL